MEMFTDTPTAGQRWKQQQERKEQYAAESERKEITALQIVYDNDTSKKCCFYYEPMGAFEIPTVVPSNDEIARTMDIFNVSAHTAESIILKHAGGIVEDNLLKMQKRKYWWPFWICLLISILVTPWMLLGCLFFLTLSAD